MIYIAVICAFFFTACTPTPFKFKMFEYEITQPKEQSNAVEEGKESENNK